MGTKTMTPHMVMSRTKFAQAMLLGMNASQAAVHAGFNSREGKRLAYEPFVMNLLAEGQKKLQKKFEYTRTKAVKLLYEAIDMSRVLEDPTAVIRAVQELNRMHGYLAPEVHEIHLSEDSSKRERQIKELSDEKLLELSAIDGEYEVLSDG